MPAFLPFLYQTRTILRANPRATIAFARSLHGSRQLRGKDDIPFVSEIDEETRGEPQTQTQTEDDGPPEPTRRSTITPSEREIFEGIFADIRARGLKPTLSEDRSTSNAARSTLSIMQQAAQDAGQTRRPSFETPHLSAGAARYRKNALLRFPPDLRAAASRALDTIGPSAAVLSDGDDIRFDDAALEASQEYVEGWKAPAYALDLNFDLEAKRRPERTRIEGLITSAKTDFELWDVLEEEVFIMPAKLGLNTRASELRNIDSAGGADKKGRRKRGPEAKALDNVPEADVAENVPEADAAENVSEADAAVDENSPSPEKLSIYVHGPLYPAYLLLALRRLDGAFRIPSSLAFSVLPRVKQLGLESYVLGVSTPFYNELLHIYWIRHGDLPGIFDLLEEMRQCGLYFDEQTQAILSRISWRVRELAYGVTSSPFTRTVMNLPEYGPSMRSRIQEWHKAVDLSIKEREDIRQKERSVGY
ncbi:hypothetical protein F4818DRAFT_421906 [Hypoxylon cercidicola]|nr:hypothetical protein F4818DRAFT_421906 [Hypoxylon cercidicola]